MGTGLKKWRPRTRWGLLVTDANSVIEMAEVLLAIRASGPEISSIFLKISCLRSILSKTASMIRSTVAASERSDTVVIRFIMVALSSLSLPFSTNLLTDHSIFLRAFFKASALMS